MNCHDIIDTLILLFWWRHLLTAPGALLVLFLCHLPVSVSHFVNRLVDSLLGLVTLTIRSSQSTINQSEISIVLCQPIRVCYLPVDVWFLSDSLLSAHGGVLWTGDLDTGETGVVARDLSSVIVTSLVTASITTRPLITAGSSSWWPVVSESWWPEKKEMEINENSFLLEHLNCSWPIRVEHS